MKQVWHLVEKMGILVAPRRGAWIETGRQRDTIWKIPMSHPAGVRGLKPTCIVYDRGKEYVAPRRGAWIET